MSQYLVMPINRAIITATYKTEAYAACYGVPHFGVDMYSTQNQIVYACGKGKVVCSGFDNVVGNTVAVVYDNVQVGDKVRSVAIRCFHMSSRKVKVGQSVTKDTILGCWGNTGMYVDGAHLHIEVDADYKNWPGIPRLYPAPSTFYYRGGDTMLDPADVLHPFKGDGQTITWSTGTYKGKPFAVKRGFAPTDVLAPKPAEDFKKKYEAEVAAHGKTKKKLRDEIEAHEDTLSELAKAKGELGRAEQKIKSASDVLQA